jgi:hypothetical protein
LVLICLFSVNISTGEPVRIYSISFNRSCCTCIFNEKWEIVWMIAEWNTLSCSQLELTLTLLIYNIRTLSVNIKFICTSFRNRQNSEPLGELFRPVSQRVQMNLFILQSVHLLYKYAIRINFSFIRTRRINFWYYTNKLFSLRINFPDTL